MSIVLQYFNIKISKKTQDLINPEFSFFLLPYTGVIPASPAPFNFLSFLNFINHYGYYAIQAKSCKECKYNADEVSCPTKAG